MRIRTLWAAVATVAIACTSPVDNNQVSSGLIELRVQPSATNARIVNFNQDHIAWLVTDKSHRIGQLMVLFPGSDGQPSFGTLVGITAAQQGYHTISLMYPDDVAVQSVCPSDPNPDCAASLRNEVITGANTSPYVSVDFDNSIDGRLAALLKYLVSKYPDDGWQQFLDGDVPRWSSIAVGGLSQGGGHAAFIAKLRRVRRVVMFGAPADGNNGAPTPWMSVGATPASLYYGFRHEQDPFTSIIPNWIALGLTAFGPVTNIDTGLPTSGTHLLTTNATPANGGTPHASVYGDAATPKVNGVPVFLAAWKYLLGP